MARASVEKEDKNSVASALVEKTLARVLVERIWSKTWILVASGNDDKFCNNFCCSSGIIDFVISGLAGVGKKGFRPAFQLQAFHMEQTIQAEVSRVRFCLDLSVIVV